MRPLRQDVAQHMHAQDVPMRGASARADLIPWNVSVDEFL